MNDITQASQILQCILYADDSSLFLSDNDLDRLVIRFNDELQNISQWLYINKLILNVKKTNYIIFTNKNIITDDIEVKINGNVVQRCNSLTFLGIQIDYKMSWHVHIEAICNKLSKVVGILYKLKHFPYKILLMIYNALFLSQLNYCNIVWANPKDYCMNRLYKFQKAIRIISGSHYLAHTKPIFVRFKCFNVFELNDYNIVIFMFLCHKGIIPPSLSNKFILNSEIHSYGTRQSFHFHLPLIKTSVSKNSIFFKGPIIWNELPSSVKSSPTLNTFKRRYKKLCFYE